jgi:dynein light chain LC8-type
MADKKVQIKNADMNEDEQQDAIECATQALEKFSIEKEIAAYIKKEFDRKYSPTWHCIVGKSYGSYPTERRMIGTFLTQNNLMILCWKYTSLRVVQTY